MMTLDEAIKHYEKVAKREEYEANNKPHLFDSSEYRQLAAWLRELKDARETLHAMYGRIGYP